MSGVFCMKRFLCILIAVSFLCLNAVALTEEATTSCTCCNCQNQDSESTSESGDDLVVTDEMSPEETYEAWLKYAWVLLYARYAEATWFYNVYDCTGDAVYLPATFYLRDNILQASEEEINNIEKSTSVKDQYLENMVKSRRFMQRMPSTYETITSSKALLFPEGIPSGYEAIDTLIMDATTGLMRWHSEILSHMAANNDTLEGFVSSVPEETKDKIKLISNIFAFLE